MAKIFKTFEQVVACLNEFNANRQPPVGIQFSPHRDFWNSMNEQEFLSGNVPGAFDDDGAPVRICTPGNGENSAIVQSLRGTAGSMFDPDTGTFGRMPADDGPYMDEESIQAIANWISSRQP